MRLRSLLSEAPKNKPIYFGVSVFITVLLLQSIFEVYTGVTGQCKMNWTDNQPSPVWGWVTVFKQHSYEHSTYSGIWITNTAPPGTPELPKGHTHPEPHHEIMYCHWLWTRAGLGLNLLVVILQLCGLVKLSLTQCHHLDNRIHIKLKGRNWD